MRKNIFFQLAQARAARILGKNGRIIILVVALGQKLQKVNWKEVNTVNYKEKFFILGRLIKAYALGKYRTIPWKTLLLITAVIVYFISPVDLIPDWLPGIGYTDDFGILLTVYTSVHSELEKFLTWEKSQIVAP